MKKERYLVKKCSVEVKETELQNLLNEGICYSNLSDMTVLDEKTFENLEEAEQCFKNLKTYVSRQYGTGIYYREVEFYQLSKERWNDTFDEWEWDDGWLIEEQTGVESFGIIMEGCPYGEKYLNEDSAREDAETLAFTENATDIFIAKYFDGEEISRYKFEDAKKNL